MALSVVCCTASSAFAQDALIAERDADAVARELANPNNSLASLTFKNQYRWYDGDLPGAESQSNYTLLFQPVFPFSMGESGGGGKANLFVRPAFPIVFDQPVFNPGKGNFGDVTALGDIVFDIGYGVTEKNGVLWALGMVGTLPTATSNRIAGDQWRLGPEALLAKFESWGVYGIFPSHQWDVAGDNYSYSTSQSQFFLTFLPGGGWNVGSTPIVTYDWENKDWSVPINFTVGKTVTIGSLPVKIALETNYYVDRPELFGTKWMVGLNITPVVPNFIEALLK